MTCSMTAFGSAKIPTSTSVYNCEIRCVNHRFLDIHLRLPEELRPYEAELKEIIAGTLSRGRVDCFIKRENVNDEALSAELDEEALHKLIAMAKLVSNADDSVESLRVADVLKWPGVMKMPELNAEEVKNDALDLMKSAVDSVQAARCVEGKKLEALIQQRVSEMRKIVAEVEKDLPSLQQKYRERIEERLAQFIDTMDEGRIEQEMILFLNKTDVMEEVDRLNVHFDEVENILKSEKSKGRRLDFLMQELNREANTLSSKSQDAKLTKQSVEIKVLIEQMREQVQNIE